MPCAESLHQVGDLFKNRLVERLGWSQKIREIIEQAVEQIGRFA